MQLERENIGRSLETMILPLWGICSVGVLAVDLIIGSNGYLIVPGFFGLLFLGYVCQHYLKILNMSKFVLICGIAFLALQIILVRKYYFETGWDSQGIVAAAEQFARREKVTAYPFSRFPNNLIMTILYSRVFRVAFSLGLSRDTGYQMILVIHCVIFFIVGQLAFSIARKIIGEDWLALAAFFIYLILIGLSPWVSILYSDALGLFFPSVVLWLYLRTYESKKLSFIWFTIGFLSFVGYKIKPTVMIVFIAISMYELLSILQHKEIKMRLLAFVGLVAGMAFCSMIIYLSGYSIDKERSFGAAHFIAMGLNEESSGVWAGEDQIYSMSFPTAKERTRGDLELAKARIKEMGPLRLFKHIVRKTRINYGSGTFSWAGEGNFFRLIREETDQIISPWIRSFYYPDGENYSLFENTECAVWLGIILLSFFSVFSRPNAGNSVVALSLLGMFMYSLLFEARARYLFVFGPFYILLATVGLLELFEKLKRVS